MKTKLDKVLTIVELGSIAVLAAFGIKAECERHKTKVKLLDTQILNCCHEINEVLYKAEIRTLKKELEELKSQEKEEA